MLTQLLDGEAVSLAVVLDAHEKFARIDVKLLSYSYDVCLESHLRRHQVNRKIDYTVEHDVEVFLRVTWQYEILALLNILILEQLHELLLVP